MMTTVEDIQFWCLILTVFLALYKENIQLFSEY